MTLRMSAFPLWLAVLLAGATCARSSAVTISRGAVAQAAIVLAEDASIQQRHAAAELAGLLGQYGQWDC